MNRPTVIIESFIPDIPAELADNFCIKRLEPQQITREAVSEADALIVRTRTRCNAALLEGSRVKLVATATIGTDHIDIPWCKAAGIDVVSAPGCNAPAVAQYVYASLLSVVPDLRGMTLGIVGVGHVGGLVAQAAPLFGLKTLLCDPPRAQREGSDSFVSLSDIASEADIITFHVEHSREGIYATHHMANRELFASLRRHPILINSARGPIVDTPALLEALVNGSVSHAIIDCWEGEPDINRSLLEKADIATPHIAGYSRQGKARGTIAVCRALCRRFGVEEPQSLSALIQEPPLMEPTNDAKSLSAKLLRDYDPTVDTNALRRNPETFEALRNHYTLRSETPELFPTILHYTDTLNSHPDHD